MKAKKVLAILLATAMTFTMAACGNEEASSESQTEEKTNTVTEEAASTETAENTETEEKTGVPKYSEIKLGEDYLDLTATVEWFHGRTDRSADGYFEGLIAKFNETYPNITVHESSSTNYVDDLNLRLSSGDWTGIIMEKGGDLSTWPDLFHPIDEVANMEDTVRWVGSDSYEGIVYGVPASASPGLGIVYNKRVWEEAGITELPKTTEEFMECLQMIKDNTDAIPLYTNYMDTSGMYAPWHALGVATTGDVTYTNQKMAKDADPFAKGNGIYDVLKVYYDAVANGLTEEDYTATDWESSKGMINSGEAACTIISSWYLAQAQQAGDHPEDVAYMVFPYSVDGKQYTKAGPTDGFAINKNDTDEVKTAALIFIKWMVEESMWPEYEKAIPSYVELEGPSDFNLDDVEMLVEENALPGEESLLVDMKEESTLLLNQDTTRPIIEAAATGSRTFDEVIDEMNQKWDDAQAALGITPEY